jgi:hypothetical protein
MIKKIVGFLVCTLLIVTSLSATGATNVQISGYVMENNESETYQSTPVKSPGIINIKIDAQIEYVYDPSNLLGGAILANDTITGKYTYDSGTPDSEPDPSIGHYDYNTSTFGIKLEAGGFVFETDPNDVNFRISIIDNLTYTNWDMYSLTSTNNSQLSNGLLVNEIGWALINTTGNAISSDVLPTDAPVLSDWDQNLFLIWGSSPSNPYDMYMIGVNVTKVTKSRSITRDIHFTMHPILIWLLERFPNLSPILKFIY